MLSLFTAAPAWAESMVKASPSSSRCYVLALFLFLLAQGMSFLWLSEWTSYTFMLFRHLATDLVPYHAADVAKHLAKRSRGVHISDM